MKQLIITLGFIALSFTIQAQQKVTQDGTGNYIAATLKKEQAAHTGKSYTDTDGKQYQVYKSGTGKLFIVRTSRKTGKQYKMYLAL